MQEVSRDTNTQILKRLRWGTQNAGPVKKRAMHAVNSLHARRFSSHHEEIDSDSKEEGGTVPVRMEEMHIG